MCSLMRLECVQFDSNQSSMRGNDNFKSKEEIIYEHKNSYIFIIECKQITKNYTYVRFFAINIIMIL